MKEDTSLSWRPLCPDKEGWGPWSSDRILDFTPCFEDFIITNIPMLFLILFGIPRLLKLSKRPCPSSDGWGGHYYSKLVCSSLLLSDYSLGFIG
ncbi:hypothetical protein BKA69DRAFT_1084383 [Paraphysoderma sedebokerense]|nr:hypothetical protein BKA69DRAFT_1084383 [Paraphysoderma sedebokerense]